MTAEENLSKSRSKLLILFLKALPCCIAALQIIDLFLEYFYIEIEITSYIVFFLFWLFVYLADLVFKFCVFHRLLLWYIITNIALCTVDYYLDLPVSNLKYLIIHLIIAGVFLFLILIRHVRSINNTKKDVITNNR